MSTHHHCLEPVAIIGMACRLPGAQNIETFWRNLRDGISSFTTFTDDQLRESGIPEALIQSPNYVKTRGIVGNAADFDAAFFGFTPREAEILDPQHRVFLECAWHAMENGGYDPAAVDGRIGIFAGAGTTWHLGRLANNPDVLKYTNQVAIVISNDKDYLPTRVSYQLDLKGPSVNVQSACSTSLVGVVLGLSSLAARQSDMVLAGGVTIELPERSGYLYQEGGMESPTGQCRAFDADANGTVFSRGCGVVLLKRLADAIADRDHIYAVVQAGAVNNDGHAKVGFTAPGVDGQMAAEIEAIKLADVPVESIDYVETHGTATQLGDPIEIAALTRAFQHHSDKKHFCAIGSVKTNIGHTDIASGAAGLIKTALALYHQQIPASLNFQKPNPKIDFENSPFFVNTVLRDWPQPADDQPRRAMVNAFGVGGTNACVVLEQAPALATDAGRHAGKLLVLSAKTATALAAMADNLRRWIDERPHIDLDDLAYTLQVGRRRFAQRLSVSFQNRRELLDQIQALQDAQLPITVGDREGQHVAFMFPGQGNQYVEMGLGLYQHEPVFRQWLDRCCDILLPHVGLDLRTILYPGAQDRAMAADKIDQTYLTQPALFAIAYAQARLWMRWGIMPTAMIGHSVGEYVAACLAGVFSLEDALMLVAARGRLIQDLPAGSMLAVLLPEAKLAPQLVPDLEVAVVNSPDLTVVSGPTPAIAALADQLQKQGVYSKQLPTSHAFHSAMMDPTLAPFAELFANVKLNAPSIDFVSTVTGDWITPAQATDSQYWIAHVRRTVRFSDAACKLLENPDLVFLEVGAGRSLESAVKNHLTADAPRTVLGSIRAATDKFDDLDYMTRALGKLWAAGVDVNWRQYYGDERRGRIALPGYPFEHARFEAPKPGAGSGQISAAAVDDRKKNDIGQWFYLPAWKPTAPPEYIDKSAVDAEETPDGSVCWVIFVDRQKLGSAIVDQLRRQQLTVATIMPGNEFQAAEGAAFTIRPDEPDDYTRVFEAVAQSGKKPVRLIHLWNVDMQPETALDEHILALQRRIGFYSPLLMEQALIKLNLLEDLRFTVITRGVFDIAGEGTHCPHQAVAAGPCRVINREHKMVRCRAVDVVIPDQEAALQRLAAQLILETRITTIDSMAAYRGGRRWVEDFIPTPVGLPDKLDRYLRPSGVYLITGGLGGLGLLFAQFLAQTVQADLMLTYRTSLPDRSQWAEWLDDHGPDDSTSQKINGIRDIEATGSRVALFQVDSSDLAGMRQAVERAQQTLGPINGVIHSAGIAGGGVISRITPAMADTVLDAKVTGALVLDHIFAHADLDFFMLFSSVTAILGEGGRVDYCAANAFMDAFAHYRSQRRPGLSLSLNWGQWGVIGMGAHWEASKARQRAAMQGQTDQPVDRLGRFSLIEKTDAEEHYLIHLHPKRDWVIGDHLIAGNPTLVGTAFFELLQAVFASKYPDRCLRLKNMYFLRPLMFETGQPKNVRLVLTDSAEGHRFVFKSLDADQDENSGAWQDHLMGEALMVDEPAPSPIDVAALITECSDHVDDSGFGRQVFVDGQDAPLIDLGRRWDCLQQMHVRGNESVGRLVLSSAFQDDVQTHALHPAMMDVATSAGIKHVVQAPYLPLGYRQLTIYGALPATAYTHIRLSDPDQQAFETLSFDVTIMDDDGNVCVEIARYSLKRISADTMVGMRGDDAAAAATKGPSRPRDILPEEGIDAMKRVLGMADMSQVVISTSDFALKIAETVPATKAEKAKREAAKAPKPTHGRPAIATVYVEPSNEIENGIAEIWQTVIGIDQVGIHDHFNELGGNSLLAMQAIANISDTFQVELSVETFFNNPTVAGIAEAIVNQLIAMTDEDTLDELLAEME